MRLIAPLLAALSLAGPSWAGDLAVTLITPNGRAVANAVVMVRPQGFSPRAPIRFPWAYRMAQKDMQFEPFVLIVPVGAEVTFPNLDGVRHHVYSFSPAKKFELPLYAGTPPEPIAFDTPGVVTLGCNIHDWMIAYILVVPTPWFRVTDSTGAAQLRGLPAGSYDVEVWQPRLKNSSNQPRQRVALNADVPLSFRLDLKPDFRLRRSPADSTGDSYR